MGQHHGLVVKGKRISCPPQYRYRDPATRSGRLRLRHGFEHRFPLIRSLRASTQRSTSVLFSFVLSLLIMAGSFAIRRSKTILARSCEAGRDFSTRPLEDGAPSHAIKSQTKSMFRRKRGDLRLAILLIKWPCTD